jgi:hypothetical protein
MTSKSNKWVEHIKKYASENGMSYREAMRADGCKSAYKMPIDTKERSPSPVREPSPEPVVSTPVKKGRGKKLMAEPDPMPMPTLVRYEAETSESIPNVIKKERKRREPKYVPT